MRGRGGDVRDLVDQLNTVVGGLDEQRSAIVRAIDSLDHLYGPASPCFLPLSPRERAAEGRVRVPRTTSGPRQPSLMARQRCDAPDDEVQDALCKLVALPAPPDDSVAWLFAAVRRRAIDLGRAARAIQVGAVAVRHLLDITLS